MKKMLIIFFVQFFFFKSFQIYMKDLESAESKEKPNFWSLQFLFFQFGNFFTQNNPNFRWIFTHSSKNRKINLFRFSLYSAYSASFIKIWLLLGGGGSTIQDCNLWMIVVNYIDFYMASSWFYITFRFIRDLTTFTWSDTGW